MECSLKQQSLCNVHYIDKRDYTLVDESIRCANAEAPKNDSYWSASSVTKPGLPMESLDVLYPQIMHNLDNEIGNEELYALTECFQSYDHSDQETHLMHVHRIVLNQIKTLDIDEQKVINARFGFNNELGAGCTLDEVGQLLGMTRDRVRKLEMKALQKLFLKFKKMNGMQTFADIWNFE